jgi:putative acetyltransferase
MRQANVCAGRERDVHPAHVRHGIGTELLGAACAWAVANGTRRFEANVSLAARPFFEAAGFRVERDQSVEYRGVTLRNFRMARTDPPAAIPK